jgi:ppGpp synthetase/RelA/SpoT-type nucleotidyltranferase
MARWKLSKAEMSEIDAAVQQFEEHRHLFDGFAKSVMGYLREDQHLAPFIHFIKYRLKSADRLRLKLTRKALSRKRGAKPEITSSNLFQKINDLAGIRILHLHTNQMREMDQHIKRILDQNKIRIIEGPIAHCWDKDYEILFKSFGIDTKSPSGDSMYTSVHYVLEANDKTKITFELQVRTLPDELWAEVSHRVAYEEEMPEQSIVEQLKVLARLTSGATRLTDCIFSAFEDLPSEG